MSIQVVGRFAVAAMLTLVGCAQWQPEAGPVPSVIAEQSPRVLRVEDDRGQVWEFANPRVQDDTLRGLLEGSSVPGTPLNEGAIPLGQVNRVAIPRQSTPRLTAAVAGPPIVAVLAYFLLGD